MGGWVDPGRSTRKLRSACESILRAQSFLTPAPSRIRDEGGGCFGIRLHHTLGEDAEDRQPLWGGGLLLVADIRVDNRAELIEALGPSVSGLARAADSEILFEALSRWGTKALARITGDYAIAAYWPGERRLVLARDPTGQRPLLWAEHREGVAFASMPSGLLANPDLRAGLQLDALARALTGLPRDGDQTYFRGIRRVLPGHAVIWENGVSRSERLWNPDLTPLRPAPNEDLVEQWRSLLDQAVRSRLRRIDGPVAAHLSSGWDSSAVAATAARLEQGSAPVIALTSAPGLGFDAAVPRGRIADESERAALTAKLHGMTHVVVRPRQSVLAHLRRETASYQEPYRNAVNGGWLAAIDKEARGRGASVLLIGELGNLTLNAGGLWVLGGMVRAGHLRQWLAEARSAARRPDVRWRGILMNSFDFLMPAMVQRSLRQVFLRQPTAQSVSFTSELWLRNLQHKQRARKESASSAHRMLSIIETLDYGATRKGALAENGIDTRDPTADQRLMEFSLRLPHDQLFANGEAKPLARRALADRVPAAILDARPRGLQSADWFQRTDLDEVRGMLDDIAASPAASELIDLQQARAAIDNWPKHGFDRLDTYVRYASLLPAALATGLFVLDAERMLRGEEPAFA